MSSDEAIEKNFLRRSLGWKVIAAIAATAVGCTLVYCGLPQEQPLFPVGNQLRIGIEKFRNKTGRWPIDILELDREVNVVGDRALGEWRVVLLDISKGQTATYRLERGDKSMTVRLSAPR